MSTSRSRLVLVMFLGTGLLGCSSTPRFNHEFGSSVRANLSAQTLDPASASNAKPVKGIDGQTARVIQEHYLRSFKEPVPSSGQGMIGVNGQ
jgi:type IV pilus biogenesis protein CpaD/CtpE